MHKHKRRRRSASIQRSIVLMTSWMLLVFLSLSGSLAMLITQTDRVTNTFTLVEVPNKVVEDIESEPGVKNDVKIQNTGDADAYIRAAVIFTWVEDKGDGSVTGNVYSTVPKEDKDYTIEWENVTEATEKDWIKGDDGYYYYTSPVAPDGETGVLLTNCKMVTSSENIPAGYTLSVEIISQSIQADGVGDDGSGVLQPAVVLAWGTTNGGSVKKVSDDRSLTIEQPSAVTDDDTTTE